jgi:hypothetical protein
LATETNRAAGRDLAGMARQNWLLLSALLTIIVAFITLREEFKHHRELEGHHPMLKRMRTLEGEVQLLRWRVDHQTGAVAFPTPPTEPKL